MTPKRTDRTPRERPKLDDTRRKAVDETMNEAVDCLAVALAHAEHLGSEFSSERPHELADRGALLDRR